MKIFNSVKTLLGYSLLIVIFSVSTVASAETVCRKDNYGRGAGTVPTACPSGTEKSGALCYQKCPAGYQRKGPVCWIQNKPYGRGAGHTSNASCQTKEKTQCEKSGLLFYPKCKKGYKATGCCICSPLEKLAKTTDVGKAMVCKTGLEMDAGLCYKPCNSGYIGVGPVCWQKTPNGWVSCGAYAGKSGNDCGKLGLKVTRGVVEGMGNPTNILRDRDILKGYPKCK